MCVVSIVLINHRYVRCSFFFEATSPLHPRVEPNRNNTVFYKRGCIILFAALIQIGVHYFFDAFQCPKPNLIEYFSNAIIIAIGCCVYFDFLCLLSDATNPFDLAYRNQLIFLSPHAV